VLPAPSQPATEGEQLGAVAREECIGVRLLASRAAGTGEDVLYFLFINLFIYLNISNICLLTFGLLLRSQNGVRELVQVH
jgi:hypothetical protein